MISRTMRILGAAAVAAAMAGAPAAAQQLQPLVNPEGQWEADNGESRYDVTLCGDGTQFCAELVWIKPEEINERNSQYLNEYVVFEAQLVRPAEWRGTINIYGTDYGGSVRILAQDRMVVTGCILILCESYNLIRIGDTEHTAASGG